MEYLNTVFIRICLAIIYNKMQNNSGIMQLFFIIVLK